MTTADATTLTADELAAALSAAAHGGLTAEAAVGLLIEQENWLRRADFRAYVNYDDGRDEEDAEYRQAPLARIRWADAVAALDSGTLRASGAEGRTLRIAASFGGGVPVNLAETMTNSLGRAHTEFVVTAVRHALGQEAGHHA